MSTTAPTPTELRADYLRWHPAQVRTGDIDPVYPVLRKLADHWRLDDDQVAWLVFLHVAYYHPGSTLAAFQLCPDWHDLDLDVMLSLPCGTERRGHRSQVALGVHLSSLWLAFEQSGGPAAWLFRNSADWLTLNEAAVTLKGNGRWAAYKLAEMAQKVFGAPITAPDAGHRYSSGPRKGLELLHPWLKRLGNDRDAIAALDFVTWELQQELGEPDVAQVETSLCDFNSLVRGRYYLGHDIDAMLADWSEPRVAGYIDGNAWIARAESFAPGLLGERQGWMGVRRELNTIYRDERRLIHV